MPNQFRNLVFEGGGVKGIAYAGAIEVLEAKNVMPDIIRVGGTSAGAITACLLALGAKSADIASIVGGTHFRDFMDDSFGVIRDTKRLLEDFGWYKGEAFSQWIRKQIYAFTGNSDLTLGQLAQLKKDQPLELPVRRRSSYRKDPSPRLPSLRLAPGTRLCTRKGVGNGDWPGTPDDLR